ncbi:hypothetical protein [Viridibacillus arvi]|uniref:hypothetical protein n=1 Tax=Viridibacillus arvi TaxID=263475 RepID=UPI0034CE3220
MLQFIGGTIGLITISLFVVVITKLGWKIIHVSFEGIVRLLDLVLFKQKREALVAARERDIQALEDMGIEIYSDSDDMKNYTSIR